MLSELNPEFAMNTEPRCPCVLLLDTSSSMRGEPISALNDGLAAFITGVAADPLASLRVEVSIITFDSDVRVVQDFVTVDQCVSPVLEAKGLTHMGTGINTALDLIESRKAVYRSNGVQYYRPWLFMITDGQPEGEAQYSIKEAAARLQSDEENRRVVFFAVGVEGANMDILNDLSVRPPARLKGMNFSDMFTWLSNSMSRVGNSRPEEQVPLEHPGWAFID